MKTPNLESADKSVSDKNDELKNYVFKLAGITIGAGMLFVYWMSTTYKFHVKDLLIRNAILLAVLSVSLVKG